MLIFTRRPGQSSIITTESGDRIRVIIEGVCGQQVRLGFEVEPAPPPKIAIHREEIQERIDRGEPWNKSDESA